MTESSNQWTSENGNSLFFEGGRDEARIKAAMGGTLTVWGMQPRAFRKTKETYAVQMPTNFLVSTLEGLMAGKAGDWLAIGAHGELYPIDNEVFEATYEPAE